MLVRAILNPKSWSIFGSGNRGTGVYQRMQAELLLQRRRQDGQPWGLASGAGRTRPRWQGTTDPPRA